VVEDRRLGVLRAIVEDYVSTGEPVGSKALADRHSIGVSPATIRNDMASLEDEGLIAQPHTSAGRVPTDKGYRLFVDRLSSVKPLSPAERRAIQAFLDEAVDLDDVVGRTVRLLAQLTRQVAIVQYPSLTRSAVRHVEFVAIGDTRVLVVLITTTGRVEQRVVSCDQLVAADVLGDLRARVNAAVTGCRLTEVPVALADLVLRFPAEDRPLVAAIVAVVNEMLIERGEERVVLAGTANLARLGPDFPQTIRPVLEALEEHMVLLRLLGELADPTLLTVRIGRENHHEGLASTSVVTAGYGAGNETVAKIGVVGPTRMDYPGTMGAVHAVARYVGQIVAGAS
jgi:heat-inducible transcriptional repressor